MERIDKESIVNTSLETIFDYVEDPYHWPEFWVNLVKVHDVQRISGGGYKAKYEYAIAGIRLKGEGEYIDYVRNNWIVMTMKGGIIKSMAFTFRAVYEERFVNRTRITLTVDYEIPIPLVRKISEKLIRNTITREIEMMMINLSSRFLVYYRPGDSVIRN